MAGLFFFGWIGYLFYLVQTRPQAPGGGPVVLSRPQFLIAPLVVIAQIDSVDSPAIVKEVVYPRDEGDSGLVGQAIYLINLKECHRLPRSRQEEVRTPSDFTGPGPYILPLVPLGAAQAATLCGVAATPVGGWGRLLVTAGQPATPLFAVEPTPPSPGYPPSQFRVGPPRIYRADVPANREQLEHIIKQK